MKRRDFFLKSALLASLGLTSQKSVAAKKPEYSWKMVTTWPKNFPGLGTGAENLANLINKLSSGRIKITVYGAGELVPAFEIFDAVSRGIAELGHGSAYYWKGKNESLQFFSTVPFGLTANEMNAWLYYGGGQELWQKAYSKFNLVPMAAGNTGIQMAGWFNKEINSLDDLKGLKMRIPGLGGEVLKRAGGTPVNLPGGELFTALKTGTIDATEWVNPYNDLAFGLHKAAKYYYYPGWHEPGTTLECFLNKEIFDSLPEDLQNIITGAAKIANLDMLSEYIARNNEALKILKDKHKVNIMPLPDEVLEMLHNISNEVISEIAKKDKFSMQVYDSYKNFQKKTSEWSKISIKSYLNI
ncbi:MAG: TRAP transporter substrate-binding protein [Pseudomonadota bacterium]|jgi:TRAP-type mannitol/chloroaromatic compound transport system substrate-binding protein|nr:TRAP transporter substrate-binding protein [Pseudomonadota bacterium]MEC9190235.1 TRAP transporter substrate-binding protein [Pseudomonadota bacterium]|tara:strand:- start:1961 stop:3028 length:1068 start_codon:yes stop_codon:yes gene_type:complete